MMKSVPHRTCLACGAKRSKSELLRFTVGPEGRLVLNNTGTLHGRGAYCCNKESCFRLLKKKRRKLSKALRVRDVELDEGLKGLFGSE